MKNCTKFLTLLLSLIFFNLELSLPASRPPQKEGPAQKKQKLASHYFDSAMFDDDRVRDLINEYWDDVQQGKELFLSGCTTPNKRRDAALVEKIANNLKELIKTKRQAERFVKLNADPLDDKQILADFILGIIDDVLAQTKNTLTRFLPKVIALDNAPFPLLESFIKAGANINDERFPQPFLIKAIGERGERGAALTKFLLINDANPNIQFNGHTPLMIAAEQGNFSTVRELLEADADPNVVSPSTGKTPLIELMKFARLDDEDILEPSNQNKVATLQLFLQRHVNLQARDGSNKTALDYATPAVKNILSPNAQMETEETTELPE